MMLCEVAAYYKKQGKTLWDAMLDMYEKYGYYKEGLATVTLKGIDGFQKIQAMMDDFRQNLPKKLGDFEVLAYRDYKEDVRKDLATGKTESTGLPASNVLYYEEPKIKFYFGVKGTSLEDASEKLEGLRKAMTEKEA